MRQKQTTLDRIATLVAFRLLTWIGKRIEPEQQLWLDALRAELDAIDGGIARLLWAVGGLQLVWFDRRRHMMNATYRYGPVLVPWLEVALFVGLTWGFIQYYGSLVVDLLELAGLALILALPVLMAFVIIIRSRVMGRRGESLKPERHTQPPLSFVLSVISLATLLGLWLSAPLTLNQELYRQGAPTAGAVVRFADHHTAEAIVDQTIPLSSSDVYLTTQVKPVAVNGSSTAQLAGLPQYPDPPQALLGIQGYDLAHSQFPDGDGMGFSSDWGSDGPGPDQILGPPGRLLDTHDAHTFNVLIPMDGNGLGNRVYNNSTITVQSLVTGQTLDLHIVGQYEPDGSSTTPLFGTILASDGVVQALTDGSPSYAYGLHLNENQIQTVFERLHSSVPKAQLYDFLSDPIRPNIQPDYSRFTHPYPASILGYADSNLNPPILLAAVWALLLAAIIVLNWETRKWTKRYGLWREKARSPL